MVTVKMFGTFRLDSGMKDVKGCIVCLHDKQVRPSTKLNDGDEVVLVPAVAGG